MATAEAETSQDDRGAQGGLAYDGFISYSHAADDLLAPRLQAGLQRFAKPWWKRRALRIFRDESSLSANPHLWSSITDALDTSGWFVLLLSPDAAESPWVNDEVEYWLANKDPGRIIPVLTDGEFAWADDDIASDAAPPALLGAFGDEPRWVDLRFARTEEQLDLNNPAFSAAVADIASPIRGVPKDELLSEEVHQHRRTVRTAWAAGIVVLLLGVAALVAATVAVGQSNEAQAQREEAQRQTEQALANEQLAQEQTALAEEQTALAEDQSVIAEDNERTARAEALAANATAQLETDPELSVLLGAQALELEARPAAQAATHAALQAHRTIFQVEPPQPGIVPVGGLTPDGELLAIANAFSDELEVWDIDAGEILWTLSTADEAWQIVNAGFTLDGTELVVYVGELPTGEFWELRMYDASNGSPTRVITAPRCSSWKHWQTAGGPYYDLSRPLVWSVDSDCDHFGTPEGELGLLDPATGQFTPVVPMSAFTSAFVGVPTQDTSGRLLAVDDAEGRDGLVVDITTGEIVYEYPGGMATLSADGSRLITGSGAAGPLELWDIENDTLLWRFDAAVFRRAFFSADESLVYGTNSDGSAYVIDAETGFELLRLRGHTAVPRDVVMSSDRKRLATFATDGTARVWDIGSEVLSEGRSYQTHSRVRGHWNESGSVAAGVAAIWAGTPVAEDNADWSTVVVDLETGEQLLTVPGGSPALSPDGSLLAYRVVDEVELTAEELGDHAEPGLYHRIGDVRIVSVRTGATVIDIEMPCHAYLAGGVVILGEGCSGIAAWPDFTRTWDIEFSPDGGLLGLTDGADGAVRIWNVATGEPVLVERSPGEAGIGKPEYLKFSRDGRQLAVFFNDTTGRLRIYETDTFDLVTEIGTSAAGMDFLADGSVFVAGDLMGNLNYFDTSDWTQIASVDAHGGFIEEVVTSPDGTLVATVGSDAVRVWNASDQALVTELFFDQAIISVSFLDDDTLLVVPTFSSSMSVITIDPDALAAVARSRVTRAFTETECLTYDIDPCPTTLEALRGG